MVLKTLVTLALATGFAAAKPINTPKELPAYAKRQFEALAALGGNQQSQAFNFIDGFNNFNNQQQVIQVKEQNLQIVDNGRQQAVVQQVNEVLIVQNEQDGFNRDLNNLFRKSSMRRERNDRATVMLVVQQIQVSVQDDRGNAFQQDVFVQSAVVANRGARETNTVMLFESKAIVATEILGNRGGRGGLGAGIAGQTNAGALLPTKTAGVQLLGAKPTWSEVVEDPAATLGAVWQAELQDLQNAEQDQADNQVNDDAAQQEKQALDQTAEEQKKKDEEAAKQAEEQKKKDEEAAKQAEEQQKQQDEQAKKDAEQQAQQAQQGQENAGADAAAPPADAAVPPADAAAPPAEA
ncbi:hypothetical protein BU23DRAFT_530 [Bimuria novae-zelandiae CBS 107.79]|uniref:Uncharacterized protein n=1 Tax=Bimuria novae-zelandiae CBS 107.79 TaxID=1447943 RepID=A0A6A5VRZ4_9PLEO|nr:hypothetical protein BU23DRAFT_530 [Bimuria novae-zelandiae CBS 107.79]